MQVNTRYKNSARSFRRASSFKSRVVSHHPVVFHLGSHCITQAKFLAMGETCKVILTYSWLFFKRELLEALSVLGSINYLNFCRCSMANQNKTYASHKTVLLLIVVYCAVWWLIVRNNMVIDFPSVLSERAVLPCNCWMGFISLLLFFLLPVQYFSYVWNACCNKHEFWNSIFYRDL